jgi:DNA-binding NarL/FixJ family response regulator
MIRILFVDDHPALRAGLQTVIEAEPGLVPAGGAAGEADVGPALARTRPDVVLLDYHLPTTNGLALCYRIKRAIPPPRVILYSAYASGELAVPAVVAGADAVIHKAVPARELFETIRAVAKGERVIPDVSPEEFATVSAGVDDEDLPIFDMLVDGLPPAEIADVMGLPPGELTQRAERIIRAMSVEVPTGTP